MATLQQQSNDTGSPISFMKSANSFSAGNSFSASNANQAPKPTTPGSQPQLPTASRNLSPQGPTTYSPGTTTSPAPRASPIQRLCNQAKAVIELARGYQKEEQYQVYSGSAGYTNGRGSTASIPDLIPFDTAQSSPPRSIKGGVLSMAAAQASGPAARFEGRGQTPAFEAQTMVPLIENQPGRPLLSLLMILPYLKFTPRPLQGWLHWSPVIAGLTTPCFLDPLQMNSLVLSAFLETGESAVRLFRFPDKTLKLVSV